MAFQSMPTTLDPQSGRISPNIALASHIYDALFLLSDDGRPQSRILTSWKAEDDHTWVFKLKEGILFHDGSPLTSKDVIYSFDRIRQLEVSDYKTFLNRWERYEALDEHTFKVVTREPNSNLLRDIGRIFILKHHDGLLTTEKFLEEKGGIGTGAYRLDGVTTTGDILLSASPVYDGAPVFLKRVRITRIVDPKERVMALKGSKIQLAEGLTEDELRLLGGYSQVDIIRSPTHRLLHLHLDLHNDRSPGIRAANGGVLGKNPLKDRRVRRAISLAINRNALVEGVLKGDGIVTGQYVLPEVTGHIAGLGQDEWAPDEARKLLAEAGYPDGFQLTLFGPNNRYLKDKEIVEEMAKMLTQVGIKTTAETLDRVPFFAASSNHQYSVSIMGVSTDGNLQALLEVLVHSQTPELGIFNDGRYSNPEVDALIGAAGRNFNQVARNRDLMQASELAINDYAIIPLYFEKTNWGVRNDIGGELWPKRTGYTVAQDLRQAH